MEVLRKCFDTNGHHTILVCQGTGCISSKSDRVFASLVEAVERLHIAGVKVDFTGCHGLCQRGPVVVIEPEGIFYAEVKPEDAGEIVQWLKEGYVDDRLLYRDQVTGQVVPHYRDVSFYAKQERRILRNCGRINPERIDDYIAVGGYEALRKALLNMTPEQVLGEVRRSGLRGRGGAGFPTALKWELCRRAPGDFKYIICNADEGDPGAYMDRSILEADPHSVIEGMIIGAYAMGARQGFIYVRAEYPMAVKRLQIALGQAKGCGFLGTNILGWGFNFSIDIECGSGAFVCGEETALIASIEGLAGEPHQRPPFPAQNGLWGKPTNINNVKTWANIPLIVTRGADWFSQVGTQKSKGTVVFSLVGKVVNQGLVEVPMGTRLSSLVSDIGGGIPDSKKFKAVQTGGPSGGCIPAQLAHLSADYETLTEAGSIMGSGGLVVMDEDTCMVDVAKYFLTFTKDEACGKCTPCREGIGRMLEVLTDITEGRGQEGDIELLEEMGRTIIDSSLCGLGGTAPNPVLTTIRYFRDEYEQHIKYKRCPAMVCNKIIFTPCKYNCPVNTDVPAFIAHIARGEYQEAFEVIRKPNPLAISCGYICHHPCEERCRSLGTGGESISIKALKRFAGDYVMRDGYKPLSRPELLKLEKVAIVGSGPAGLAAAFDLSFLGYQPTVIEASSVVGGNLALVIPEYRMPRRIVDLEIECIKQAGVTILTNTPVGQNPTIDDLFAQGYKAILLATGAHRSLKLGLPSEDIPDVIDAFGFLKAIKFGKAVSIGEKVGVIGGGNCAIDAARTALRTGAKEVSIIYRRSKAEMPAMKREIEAGVEEGVKIIELTAPVRIITRSGRLAGVECLAIELGDFDDTGRRRPIPIPGSEFVIMLDNLIPAIGEEPDLSFLPPGYGLEISNRNTIAVDPESMATNRPGIFAAGDAVTGPSTIADSIASGKLAAQSIHKFLQGQPVVRDYSITVPCPRVEPVPQTEEMFELQRFPMPCAPAAERVHNFGLVELGLSEEVALKEARRCLRCDMR